MQRLTVKGTVMRNTTRGFYSLEASIVLPFVILAVLSLGYFMKVEGTWENCVHGAADESVKAAAYAYETGMAVISRHTLESRITEDNPDLDEINISRIMTGYSDMKTDKLTSFHIDAAMKLELPLGLGHEFTLKSKIKFRGFVGSSLINDPCGSDGLESEAAEDPVWVFPQTGEKYHSENCTYVKASVRQELLDSKIKSRYKACSLCNSGDMPSGSIVFCFEREGTAYHRGSCASINRHTMVMDRSEAVKKGYGKCSKCVGG